MDWAFALLSWLPNNNCSHKYFHAPLFCALFQKAKRFPANSDGMNDSEYCNIWFNGAFNLHRPCSLVCLWKSTNFGKAHGGQQCYVFVLAQQINSYTWSQVQFLCWLDKKTKVTVTLVAYCFRKLMCCRWVYESLTCFSSLLCQNQLPCGRTVDGLRFAFSPDVIPCGWPGSKHQLIN